MAELDLQFQQFGAYFVLGKGQKTAHGQFWICQCQCNAQKQIHEAALIEGRATGCGCDHRDKAGRRWKTNDLTGQQIGSWLILHHNPGTIFEDCLCLCGTSASVHKPSLLSGKTANCRRCQGHKLCRVKVGRWYKLCFVIKRIGLDRFGRAQYLCRCGLCGREFSCAGVDLLKKTLNNCGCDRSKGEAPVIGRTFYRWHVLELATPGTNGKTRFICQCICPKQTIKTVYRESLVRGRSKSCGCLAQEIHRENITRWNVARSAPGRLDWTLDVMRQHATAQSSPAASGDDAP